MLYMYLSKFKLEIKIVTQSFNASNIAEAIDVTKISKSFTFRSIFSRMQGEIGSTCPCTSFLLVLESIDTFGLGPR